MTTLTAASAMATTGTSQPLHSFLWFAMAMGALSLLTPCVFPMVPITVSYFSNHGFGSRRGGSCTRWFTASVGACLVSGAAAKARHSPTGAPLRLLEYHRATQAALPVSAEKAQSRWYSRNPGVEQPMSVPKTREISVAALLFCACLAGAWGQTHTADEGGLGDSGLYGYATLSPQAKVVAGSWGTWTVTYHVGKLGVDDAGQILLLTRAVSDWGPFQADNSKGDGYASVTTTGHAKISMHFDSRHAFGRPWWRGLVLTLSDGYLQAGDEVNIVLGDRSGGSRGTRAQTFDLKDFEFRVMVDPLATGRFVRVESPHLEVVSAPAANIEAVWPTEVRSGQATWLQVRATDVWGNPATSYTGTVQLTVPTGVTDLPQTYTFRSVDGGFHRFEGVHVKTAGEVRIAVSDVNEPPLQATSNPLRIIDDQLVAFWGDLHGQSGESFGSGTVDRYFAFARGFAAIDFASHQANDFEVTKATWKAIQEATKQYHQPHRFVAFLGYEWSGNTGNGGDHNVIFLDDDEPIHRSSHSEISDLSDIDTDRITIRDLAATLPPGRAILIPHIGGRRANLDFFDPTWMPAIEIYSIHGQFEWFLRDALQRGLVTGFVSDSDDHFGHPGDAPARAPTFFAHGGLVCIYTSDLTRESLWEGLRARRTYGTTGERIGLRFQSGTHWMGEKFAATGAVPFSVEVNGTSGIERVDVFRGVERVYRYAGSAEGPADRLAVIWRGARNRQRARVTNWDGGLTITGATIRGATGYRFDYPTEGIRHSDEKQVQWLSNTAGDEDGVILDVDNLKHGSLTFKSEPAHFTVQLGQITTEDWVFPAGGLDREVVLRRVARAYARDVKFDWIDRYPLHGTTAYWVRVLQQDGATAWSSPIYVTQP